MQIKIIKKAAIALIISLPPITTAMSADCITDAAQCFQINPLVIKAIIWQESRNQQQTININKNKTVDIGVMQINTVHFKSLKAHGIDEELLRENSCANVFSGTWILKKSIERYGYTWTGIGNYHSHTPLHHDKYIREIIALIAYHSSTLNKVEVARKEGIREQFLCSQY
ncbi:lytic transglycosylase domain-containing protein [Klebsiella aerogenes]|nr:lytic transglycosylase domain-containing protein [Klebsiella aerogenes]